MRERHVPRPLPEGNHGPLPEGARGELKPIARMHERAKAVFDKDPNVYTKRIGEFRTKLPNNSTLVIEALTQDTVDEGYDSHRIFYYEKFPNGRVIPLTSIYLDESGALQRNDSALKRESLAISLDALEERLGLQEVDPITGELAESTYRKDLEAEARREIDEEAIDSFELGFSAISDKEAVSMLQSFQQVLPSWPEDVHLPEKGEDGQPQEETVRAFMKITESIANDEVIQFSEWEDKDGAHYTLSSHSLIAYDGTEIPDDITLEREVSETEGMMESSTSTVWRGERRGTFKTGSYDRMLRSPRGESYTPQIHELNKAATAVYKAHMGSPESDAPAQELNTVLQLISERASQLEQQQTKDQPEERGPETSALATHTGQVDVVLKQEPQVGGSAQCSIADLEDGKPGNTDTKNHKGKSK